MSDTVIGAEAFAQMANAGDAPDLAMALAGLPSVA